MGDYAREFSRRQRHARHARPAQRNAARRAQPRALRLEGASVARRRRDMAGDRRAEVSRKTGRTTFRRIRPPKARRRTGRSSSSGRFRPEGTISRASSGAARCRAAYSDPSDDGDSWELNRPLWDDPRREEWFGGGADHPGIHSICVDPRDARHVLVGVSCGGVWRTRDDGQTWDIAGTGLRAEFMPPERQFDPNVQDPHLVAQCRGEALTRSGFSTTTGFSSRPTARRRGREITDVKPSTFGFPVAVHPRDPNTAWFVPAVKDEKRYPAGGCVVVNRTRDGGKTFDTLTQRPAAGARLRPGVPPRARRRRERRPSRVRFDDRLGVGAARTAAIRGRRYPRICRRFMQ